MNRVIYWWRRLRRRCTICGTGRQVQPTASATDLHVVRARAEHLCRKCAKTLNFTRLYGASNSRIKAIIRNQTR